MNTRKERRTKSCGGTLGAAMWLVTTTVVLLHCCTLSQAQYAKSSYYMNSLSDCNIAGFWVMRSDDVVNIFSRRPGSTTSDLSDCAIRLKLDDARDILDVTMSEMQINDRDVVLTVDLTGGATWTLTGGSKNPGKMTAKGGQVTISLTRLYKDQDNDYYFSLIVRAYKESDLATGNDESPVAVGLVVGIVGGIIGFLIFIAVIVVCCWRRRKREAGRPVSEYKEDLTTGKGVSPADSYGVDNAARNGTSPPRHNSGEYFDDSPRMKKQLLNDRFEYRDQSDTESESKDPYIMKRFDQSPTKRAANMNYENENRRQEGGNVQMRNNPPGSRPPPGGNAPRNPPPAPKPPPPPVAAPRSDQNRTGLPTKSPVLDALHKNPRFRASYHANEDDADDRARRISGDYAKDDGHESDASMTMTWNTTFDTNFDDDPRPPTHSFVKPPTLPPVPKSPKAALRRENTASIRRNPRPSSSSSEIEQIEEGRISMNPKGSERDPPPVRGEVVPIRIQDPHSSPTMKRKPDTQHTLRPDRSGGKPKPAKDKEKSVKEKRKQSPESRRSDSPSSERKGPKSKKPTDKAKSSNAGSDYETGRFRKADTARKSKGKTPRIGRSRSTGNAMDDDASSIGRPTTPRGYEGYQAVPRVTADDYEDSDVESNLNYNPLRRSGSKSSLYASRSSLYGRRRRKGSMGSVHSLVAHDDLDFRERDSFKDRSLSRRDRNFRSLGDLEHELRDSTTRSTQTLRECATQTGTGFANVIPGKKTTVKKGRPKSVSSSHTQTAKSKNRKERNLDTSSSSSGVYKPRPRTNSASSTSRVKSRDRRDSGSSVGGGKPRRAKSESELKKKLEAEDKKKKKPPTKPKPAPKPKPRPRKSTASVGNLSDDDAESVATGMTGPVDQSSVAGGYNPAMTGQPVYPPQAYPGYPMGYPPPQMPYGMVQFGQPGMPPMPGAVPMPGGPMHTRAVAPNAAGAGVPSLRPAAPGVAPKPSKWDQLCKITDSDKSPADSSGSGSTNVYGGHYFPPGYASAVGSEYGSERSGPARSTGQSQIPRKSSWHALKELADKEGSQYSASESNI